MRVRAEPNGDGVLTDFRFGYDERIRCRFTVSADGRHVASVADPAVSDRDLLALFGEHILRTVLVRRDLISFHAAALSDDEAAILIMGDKGMGKSTLSSALQQRSWRPIADDLARVGDADGTWRTFGGLRDTKLHADSIAALGLNQEALPPRWDDSARAHDDKRLLHATVGLPVGESSFRVAAMFVLRPRRQEVAELSYRRATSVRAVQALLDHGTRDPLHPETPPRALQHAIGNLLRAVPMIEVALPDRLNSIRASAEQIELLARRLGARRAA